MARGVADLRAAPAALNFESLSRRLGALIQAAFCSSKLFFHCLQMRFCGSISLDDEADPFLFEMTVGGHALVGTVQGGPQARGVYSLRDRGDDTPVAFPHGMELRVPPYEIAVPPTADGLALNLKDQRSGCTRCARDCQELPCW